MECCIILIEFSINFWRPFCTPLKPHALTILATQSADTCPQRPEAHPSRSTFTPDHMGTTLIQRFKKTKNSQEQAKNKCQQTQITKLQNQIIFPKPLSIATTAQNLSGAALLPPLGAFNKVAVAAAAWVDRAPNCSHGNFIFANVDISNVLATFFVNVDATLLPRPPKRPFLRARTP